MSQTDDIAEKVSDLLLEQTVKGGAFISSSIPPAISGLMSATSNTINQLRTQLKNDKDLRRLMSLEGEVSEEELNEAIRKLGLVSSTVHVADADAKEFADLLNERKVLFARLDKTDDNCKLFVFLTRDAEKVQEAAQLLQARRGIVTELNPDLFFNGMRPESVKEVAGLDSVELELFRHYARKQALVFTVMPSQDGKNDIYFESRDEKKANRVLLDIGWMLSGSQRDLVRKQLEDRINGRNAIREAVDDPQKELYIVSAVNPAAYIWINEKNFSQYKNGKEISKTPRDRDDFAERCMAYCDGLEHPVVLAPDDFRSDLTVTDMSRYPTTDFMSKGFEEAKEQEKLNDLLTLVARKSGLDNEHDADISLWDSSVSFSEFAANETYEDNDSRRKAEEDYKRLQGAATYPKEHFAMEELNMDQRNLDFIILRAQQKQRAQAAGPFHEKEERDDLSAI